MPKAKVKEGKKKPIKLEEESEKPEESKKELTTKVLGLLQKKGPPAPRQ